MTNSNWRRFYPRDVDIIELDSSNDTESDIPGHGRLLGRLYKNLGRHVESFVNRVAVRYEAGPTVVAIRVKNRAELARKRARYLQDYTGHFVYVDKEEAVQRKDLKKLIGYTKLISSLES